MSLLAGTTAKRFRCGEDSLDRYLQTQATQDIRRNIANCFVAVEIARAPAVRIGRLAVDERFHGRGLGAAILMDAKNDQAAAFYQRSGFRAVIGRPRTFFLPIATMHDALTKRRGPKA